MQRKIIGLLVLLVAGCVLLAGCTGSTPATNNTTTTTGTANISGLKDTYIIGIDNAYKPFSYQEKDGSFTGFDIESSKWIANKMGFKVEHQGVAWDGIIPALLAKKIDMVYAGMTITPERAAQVAFSKPYLKINQSIAVRADSPLTKEDVMAGKAIIGSQRGTTGEAEAQKLIDAKTMPASNLKSFDNFPLAVQALVNGQVQATIYDKPSTIDAIAGQPVKIIGDIDTNEQYGIAIRKEDTLLLETMNKGLDQLMADPYWNELKAKYNLTET
jgi:polar amino acid transport system substrate-binding protein